MPHSVSSTSYGSGLVTICQWAGCIEIVVYTQREHDQKILR